jgi:hypothetical protein
VNRLLFIDVATGTAIREVPVQDPRGLYATPDRKLYVVEGRQVKRYNVDFAAGALSGGTVVARGLEDPQAVTFAGGMLYVSDWGASHQVKVFNARGRRARTIGTAGGPQLGLYDETRMAYPRGLAVDTRGQLWVAERHYAPKRISRWSAAKGLFQRAWYGPPKYGGGGMLDPRDRTRFYYAQVGEDSTKRAYEFVLDWTTGANRVRRVLVDDEHFPPRAVLPERAPEVPRYVGARQFMVSNNQHWGSGRAVVGVWAFEDDRLVPVAAAGAVARWDDVEALGEWTAYHQSAQRVFFVWSDLDGDTAVDAGEVQYHAQDRSLGTVYVEKDLSITSIWGHKVAAPALTAGGVPVYDMDTWTQAVPNALGDDRSSYHLSDDDLFISLLGPVTFVQNGKVIAQYHSQWPNRNLEGLPVPTEQYAGQLLNTSRPLGDLVTPGRGEAGRIWGVNGEYGQAWLLTWDGLFITRLLADHRTHPHWRAMAGEIRRGSVVEGVSGGREQFWPTLNQAADGTIYFVAGKEHASILRLDGLETVRRLHFGTFQVTAGQLAGAAATRTEGGPAQARLAGTVTLGAPSPRLDGSLGDWQAAAWMTVDDRLGLRAALAADATNLYLALRTGRPDLLNNSGAGSPALLFSTGGGIDLTLGRPGADPQRSRPVEGDLRIVITREGADPAAGPLRATLFEQVNAAAPPSAGYAYTSPIGETYLDRVVDITAAVTLRQQGGDYEVAIPLGTLGLAPAPGGTILGDVGVLIGDGVETVRRVYWNNKVHTLTSDLPSEAALLPASWGLWTFRNASAGKAAGLPAGPAPPASFSLEQNYPNPFNPSTYITYHLPEAGDVVLELYDALGRRVATLVDAPQDAGSYTVAWDGSTFASGLYLCRLHAGSFVGTRPMMLVK